LVKKTTSCGRSISPAVFSSMISSSAACVGAVKITGYQDYDLLALPKGEKPAAFKVAKQAQ
jgi:hypothetical protein